MGSFIPCHETCLRVRAPGVIVDRLVIHRMQGTLEGTLSWFAQPAPPRPLPTATHFAIGERHGVVEVVQLARMSARVLHCGSPVERGWNDRSIGIELEGFVGDPWPAAIIEACADLVRVEILPRYPHILPDREHMIGHREVPGVAHTDPGTDFPWAPFLARVLHGG